MSVCSRQFAVLHEVHNPPCVEGGIFFDKSRRWRDELIPQPERQRRMREAPPSKMLSVSSQEIFRRFR